MKYMEKNRMVSNVLSMDFSAQTCLSSLWLHTAFHAREPRTTLEAACGSECILRGTPSVWTVTVPNWNFPHYFSTECKITYDKILFLPRVINIAFWMLIVVTYELYMHFRSFIDSKRKKRKLFWSFNFFICCIELGNLRRDIVFTLWIQLNAL